MRIVLSVLLASAALVTLELSNAAADDGNLRFGRALYLRENCYVCHGGLGGGGMGPNLRDSNPNDDRIARLIRNGSRTGMPAYGDRLSARQIRDLIAYIDRIDNNDAPRFTHWWEFLPPR